MFFKSLGQFDERIDLHVVGELVRLGVINAWHESHVIRFDDKRLSFRRGARSGSKSLSHGLVQRDFKAFAALVGFVFQQAFHIGVEGYRGAHDAIMTAFPMLSRCRLDNVLELPLRQWDAGAAS